MKIIAHRGASGYHPEHSLTAYKTAIEMGADIIEPDLVCTQDGVLVARHEPALSGTTNVAEISEFRNKKKKVEIDGECLEDWFCFDFTFEELKKLTLKNRYDFRPKPIAEDRILSFEEVLELVLVENKSKNLIVYPEIKHPIFHYSIGLDITSLFLEICKQWNFQDEKSPLWVQCFEPSCLQTIRKQSNLNLFQLIDGSSLDENGNVVLEKPNEKPFDFVKSNHEWNYKDLVSDDGLKFISSYANGVGIWKNYLLSCNDKNQLINTGLAEKIKARNLGLHIFTFRDEEKFRLKCFQSKKEEYKAFFKLKPDAIFSDFPDTAIEVFRDLHHIL